MKKIEKVKKMKTKILFIFGISVLLFLFGCSFDKVNENKTESTTKHSESMKEKKESLTLDKFKSISKKFGYEIEDIKNFDIENVKTLTFAKKKYCKIEFYTTKSNEDATNLFKLYKIDFEKQYEKSHNRYKSQTSLVRYFSVLIGNDFMIICHINNNFIYLKADKSSKKEIKELLKEFGCYDPFSWFFDSLFEAMGNFLEELFTSADTKNKSNSVESNTVKETNAESTEKQNRIFVKNTEQFKEIASKYGYKTYEECGLKSEDYKTDNIPIGPKIKNTITLLNGKEIIDMSSATFKEFENEKSVVEYVKEQKDFEAKHMKEQYLDLTIKEVYKGKAKRTIISTIYEVDTNKEGISDIVYIYSQHDNNLIEIIHVGANLETEYKMLDEMGY